MNSKFPVLIAGTYEPAGVGGIGSLIPNDVSFSSINTVLLFEADFNFYLF
jgi:hypothetical protein